MRYLSATFCLRHEEDLPLPEETILEIVAAIAGEAGFESFEQTSDGLKGYIQDEVFDKDLLNERIADFPIQGVSVEYQLNEAEYKNWNEDWERGGFEPIYVSDKCVIHDTHHDVPVDGDIIDIVIDAKMAFGTGCHETTRLLVSKLLSIDLKDKRVLDCGTGTGILGIVASKCGAKDVVGYDIDEWSVENSRHNARLNNVNNMEVLTGDSKVLSHVNGLFDVVLANINRNILVQDLPEFKEVLASDGIILLSGFYRQDVDILIEEGYKYGLSLIGTSSDGDWAALALSTATES